MEKIKTILAVIGGAALIFVTTAGGLFLYGMDCMQVGVSGQHLWDPTLWFQK